MQREFRSKDIVIDSRLSNDTKDLIRSMLRTDGDDRCDIKWVLNHPALRKNVRSFEQPITENEFTVLIKNYIINTKANEGRDLPDALSDFMNLQNQGQVQQRNNGFFDDVAHLSPRKKKLDSIMDFFGDVSKEQQNTQPKHTDQRIFYNRDYESKKMLETRESIMPRFQMFESTFSKQNSGNKHEQSRFVKKPEQQRKQYVINPEPVQPQTVKQNSYLQSSNLFTRQNQGYVNQKINEPSYNYLNVHSLPQSQRNSGSQGQKYDISNLTTSHVSTRSRAQTTQTYQPQPQQVRRVSNATNNSNKQQTKVFKIETTNYTGTPIKNNNVRQYQQAPSPQQPVLPYSKSTRVISRPFEPTISTVTQYKQDRLSGKLNSNQNNNLHPNDITSSRFINSYPTQLNSRPQSRQQAQEAKPDTKKKLTLANYKYVYVNGKMQKVDMTEQEKNKLMMPRSFSTQLPKLVQQPSNNGYSKDDTDFSKMLFTQSSKYIKLSDEKSRQFNTLLGSKQAEDRPQQPPRHRFTEFQSLRRPDPTYPNIQRISDTKTGYTPQSNRFINAVPSYRRP